jgi:hypothetical protein
MIRISKKSRLNPDEILAKASRYFGKGGEGLDETESGPCCISFPCFWMRLRRSCRRFKTGRPAA